MTPTILPDLTTAVVPRRLEDISMITFFIVFSNFGSGNLKPMLMECKALAGSPYFLASYGDLAA